jgi:hypothetical protein
MASKSSNAVPKGTPLTTSAKLDVLAHGLHALEKGAQGGAASAGAGTGGGAPGPAPGAGAAADTRPLTFTVTNATASIRITLVDDPAHPEVVVPAGATTGTSQPRPDDTPIDLIVELLGSGGSSADVAITNAKPAAIHPSIPNDYSGSWYPIQYTIKTSW